MDDHRVPVDNATTFTHATETVQFLEKQLPEALQRPRLGIICGSGLGGLAEMALPQPRHEVSYTDVPHLASSSGRNDVNSRLKPLILANPT